MAFITTYGDKTSSQSTDYPDYISDLIKKGYGGLSGIADGMLSRLPGYSSSVAPWNKNLQGAYDGAGGILTGNKDWSSAISQSGKLTPDSIAEFSNPYAAAVGDQTMKAITDSYSNRSADAAARAASGVAFGGSGSALALERALNDRNEAKDKAAAMAGILSDSFNTGAQLASGNADRGLQAAIGADNASTNFNNRGLDALQSMLSTGQMRQGYDQSVADLPWTDLQKLMSMLPGAPTTTTKNDPQTIDWLAILGALGSKAFGF